MQIDAIKILDNTAVCNLYTADRCVKIIMTNADYEALNRDGFFIRDGRTKDSAGVINTTRVYQPVKYVDGHMELDRELAAR